MGTTYREPNKKQLSWPCIIAGSDYFLEVYADSTFPPPKMVAKGFLLMDKNYDVVREKLTCEKAIRTWHVWFLTYLTKIVPMPTMGLQKSGEKLLNFYVNLFEQCETRISTNKYEETPDPLEQRLGRAIRALDKNFVQSYELLTNRVNITKALLEAERDIWNFREFEKVESFIRNTLPEFKASNAAMESYLPARARLTAESKEALDAYLSSKSSLRLAKSASTWLLVLLTSVNLPAGLTAVAVGEALKFVYDEITGYQKLVRGSEQLENLAPKIFALEKAFDDPIPPQLIRGLSQGENVG